MCLARHRRDNDKEVGFGNPSCSSDMNLNTLVLLLRFETSQVPGGVPEALSSPGRLGTSVRLMQNYSKIKDNLYRAKKGSSISRMMKYIINPPIENWGED